MKSLYLLSLPLVGILALGALNPETVSDLYDDTKDYLVTEPRMVEDLAQRIERAEEGDTASLYAVGRYHVSSDRWAWPDWYERAAGEKDPEKGGLMLERAAQNGHPEAIFWLWQNRGGDERMFVDALKAGSNGAIHHVLGSLYESPCDETLHEYIDIVLDRLDYNAYPWVPADAPEDHIEYRREWKTSLYRQLTRIDQAQEWTCPAA